MRRDVMREHEHIHHFAGILAASRGRSGEHRVVAK